MHRIMWTLGIVGLLGGAACGGKGAPAAGGAEGPAAAAPGAEAAAAPGTAAEWKELKVDKVGVTVTAPGDATLSALGGVSAMGGKCQADMNTGGMKVTFENRIQNIEAGHIGGALKEFQRKDKTGDDDWVIEFTTEKKFGYMSSRTVGGQAVSCGRVAASAEARECVKKICESMK